MHDFAFAKTPRGSRAPARRAGTSPARSQAHVLQRALGNSAVQRLFEGPIPSIVQETLNTPGERLYPQIQAEIEARFDHDFEGLRVHDGGEAAESASAVNAKAYTVGEHIVFGRANTRPTPLPAACSSPTSLPMSCSRAAAGRRPQASQPARSRLAPNRPRRRSRAVPSRSRSAAQVGSDWRGKS